jgi:hypothetical protein
MKIFVHFQKINFKMGNIFYIFRKTWVNKNGCRFEFHDFLAKLNWVKFLLATQIGDLKKFSMGIGNFNVSRFSKFYLSFNFFAVLEWIFYNWWLMEFWIFKLRHHGKAPLKIFASQSSIQSPENICVKEL